ncbi:MAG: DUF6056 family protein [Clostridia bacterium]
MDKLKGICKKHSVVMIFIVFFILVLLQHQFIYMYHDDYGYASLSYGFELESVKGMSFGLGEIFEFLIGHYLVWGGRVFTFLFEIIFLKSGLPIFRLVQSLVITFIFLLIYLIAKRKMSTKGKTALIALFTVSCYGVFNISLLRNGMFWASASISYIFPLLPLLLFVYLYDKRDEIKFKNNIIKILFYIFCAILIFMAGFSQEQISVLIVSYMIFITFFNWKNSKKINKVDIIMLIICLVGFSLLMLAPGNNARKLNPTNMGFYNLSFIEKLSTSIPDIILNNFSIHTNAFTIMFFAGIIYICYKNLKEKSGNLLITKISTMSSMIIFLFSIIYKEGYFNKIYCLRMGPRYKVFMLIIFFIQLAMVLYVITIYLGKRKEKSILALFYGSILSQGAMALAPYFPLRSVFMFEFIVFIVLAKILYDVFLENKKSLVYIVIPLLIVLLYNYIQITHGYYKNSSINRNNDEILKQTSTMIKEGEIIKEINLNKLNNPLYSGEQPYTVGNEYILKYIKQYYDLPKEIQINYQ